MGVGMYSVAGDSTTMQRRDDILGHSPEDTAENTLTLTLFLHFLLQALENAIKPCS